MKHHPDYTRVFRCSSRQSMVLLTQVMEDMNIPYDLEKRPGFYEIGYMGPQQNSAVELAWNTLLNTTNLGR